MTKDEISPAKTRSKIGQHRVRKEEEEVFLFFCVVGLAAFDLGAEVGQSVAVWQSCLRCMSVGELLCNYQPCADSPKVNVFPFRLSAPCLQLRCSPPPLHLALLKPAATVQPTSRLLEWRRIYKHKERNHHRGCALYL